MSPDRETALQLSIVPCLSDNYGYLIFDPVSSETVAVDSPAADAILQALSEAGWSLTQIWNTHWHQDHAGGNQALKDESGCHIIGPAEVADRLNAPVDEIVAGGHHFKFGNYHVEVLDVPGHTLGHIAFYIPEMKWAFVGDALFSLGCGRMFEGNPEMFWKSLSALRALPDDVQIFCAHEYTKANLAFALSVDPDNADLQAMGRDITAKRAANQPTLPTTLGLEKRANPFLRPDVASLQAKMQTPGDTIATFAALRSAKDNF